MFLKKLFKQNQAYFWLGVILLLAVFLRFYRLPELMVFIGDQGRDYLAARDMLINRRLALVGIPSSVPWLKQGPVFIWLLALTLKLGNFHPLSPAILTAAFGVLAVYLLYRLGEQWFSRRVAALAALQLAASPLAVIHSRMPYHISPIPLFAIFYLLALYCFGQKKLSLFWVLFSWALLFQFELTIAPLILLIPLVYWHQKITLRSKELLLGFLGLILPFMPKIIYDFSHGFKQTLGFIAWLGYRIISFFGFQGRHTVSLLSLKQVSLTIFNYWQKFFSWGNPTAALVFLGIILAAIIHRLILVKRRPLQVASLILFSFLFINLLAFYIHQAPSEAYFPVLFPVWSLLTAWSIDYWARSLPSKQYLAAAATSTLILVVLFNAAGLSVKSKHFNVYGPSLSQRILVTKFIIANSQSQPFKLKNYYSVSQFPSYLDNYRYLLWWLGKAEDPAALQTYMIYEGSDSSFSMPLNSTIYHFSKIKLIKL
jgi:4-amino-4-deoxy-L-arabinose transferase-like glycosyltransferase